MIKYSAIMVMAIIIINSQLYGYIFTLKFTFGSLFFSLLFSIILHFPLFFISWFKNKSLENRFVFSLGVLLILFVSHFTLFYNHPISFLNLRNGTFESSMIILLWMVSKLYLVVLIFWLLIPCFHRVE